MPVYEPSDRLVLQVAGRAILRPDVVGEYAVTATITTKSNGTATVADTIFGATYAGINACSQCHDGQYAPLNKVASWSTTGHANWFTNGVSGVLGSSYGTGCYSCHTVGYDPNDPVQNGGFDKIAAQLAWVLPLPLQPSNWTNLPDALKNVANIQCENCHGAGSLHADSGGTPFLITVPNGSNACDQCHDDPTHHFKQTEWFSSMHAVATTDPAGNAACVGCHTKDGFIVRMNNTTPATLAYTASPP